MNILPGRELMVKLEVPLGGNVVEQYARCRVVKKGQLKGVTKGRDVSCVTQSLTEIFSGWKADELSVFWGDPV